MTYQPGVPIALAAETLGVTPRQIRRLIAAGELEPIAELDDDGRRLVTIESVGAAYRRRTHQPAIAELVVDVPTGGRL